MILFYITHTRDEDLSLFVSARTRAEAIKIWRDWVSDYDHTESVEDPEHVFLVPKLSDVPTHHPWHEKPGVIRADEEGLDESDVQALALKYGTTAPAQGAKP